MKKTIIGALTALTLSTTALAAFPDKDIQGIIQWGAGGSTDTVMRSISPHVEAELGTDIILTNKTGGVGAIALKYVNSKKDDGYTLLMGAENPQMYKVLGLGDTDYNDMIAINVLARGTPVFVASNEAPYNNMKEFTDYIKANPGTVKIGSTGNGGLTSIVMAMLKSQVALDYTSIPYNGDGPALTALQGGAIDVMPAVLGATIEQIKAGRMKVIGLVDKEANRLLPGIAPITDTFPGLKSYLPWGPFFGVFVKQGTPDDVVKTLQGAFHKAAFHPDFVDLMQKRGFTILNISGEEADYFLSGYRSTSSWLVHDAGFSKKSPEAFHIPRP
ncbi:Bug family tripartite tricarboxylate transporter substrate binding protein [Marinomonas sp. IMCC 4694]|uniref:Bug family tripartite tricarboxylate transporter substrate binding protein n=1 Tax=Marinomonas sp. IMCC 4694 TaxID=2605432 RepID=UPI0011E6990F|nr:tripartite tricarboxylate transporter substrate binding protein [Marinomonas sp. IMCC 4694]TYL48840.1 tripartite tricarboxylate transporter substrate binding protein [Marinomonas sp. IMCC 4694]